MARSKKYKYDVFISHAVEDKIPIAIELDEALRKRGLAVWFSGKELSIGDRLTQSIYNGLDDCRFGVVIISPTYLSKVWPMAEFFTLVQREKEGHKVVLPVLYDITPQELAVKYPPMADIFSVSASIGVEKVTEVIINEISKSHGGHYPAAPKNRTLANMSRRTAITAGVFLLALATVFGFWKMFPDNPPSTEVQAAIQQRIDLIQSSAQQNLQHLIQSDGGRKVAAQEIKKMYTEFIDTKSYYRNEYILNIGDEVIRSKRNVESALAIDMDNITPFNQYDFNEPSIYLGNASSQPGYQEEQFAYYNTHPVRYTIIQSGHHDKIYQVKVTYDQPLRMICTTLDFPSSSADTKRHQMTITSLRPTETFSFKKDHDRWVLKSIE